MSRKLNWEKAKREDRARRTAAFHDSKRSGHARPPKPPSPAQLRYIRTLSGQLGRDVPEVSTSGAARAEITKLKNILAVTRT